MIRLTTCLLLLWTSLVNAGYYSTSIDSPIWQASGDVFACQLSHEIPNYGQMLITQSAGRKQQLSLLADLSHDYKGKVNLYSEPPSWQIANGASPRYAIGKSKILTGKQTVVLPHLLTKSVIKVLKHGRQVSFEFKPNKNPDAFYDQVMVTTAGFQPAYDNFAGCLAKLLPVSFDDLQKSNIFFKSDSFELTDKAKQWLNYVITYAKHKEEPIKFIQLEGFTDSLGKYKHNRLMSLKRVWAVKDYLVYNGISPKYIRVRGMASRNPIASNASESGRAKNRRVNIMLGRDPYIPPQY